MHHGLDPGQRAGIGGDPVLQCGPVDAALPQRGRAKRGQRCNRRTAWRIKPMHGCIGIPDGNAFVAEQGGGCRFAHANGSGQAKAERAHALRTAARVASSTSGRWPNQRSNPGAA